MKLLIKIWQKLNNKIQHCLNWISATSKKRRNMNLDDLPDMDFDIDKDSSELKDLVSIYDSQFFLADIARISSMHANPRINMHPFNGLSSPFRQLAHLGALNVTSKAECVTKKEVDEKTDEWKNIVVQSIKARAGYYEEMMPKEGDVLDEYHELYKISQPVFDSHFDTTTVNYEEQELNKIKDLFTPFDSFIKAQTGLVTRDFIEIYNTIDYTLSGKIKESYNLFVRSASVQREKLKNKGSHPRNWNYKGMDQDVLKVIEYHTDPRVKHTPSFSALEKHIPKEKLHLFFDIFSIKRGENIDYKYYTEINPLLLKPIYQFDDDKYLVVFQKHLSHSIFRFLFDLT